MDSNGMPYSQEILDAMQGDSTGYAESRDTSTVPATATMATEPWYPLGHSSELAAPIGTRVSMNSENIDPAKNATGYAIVHQIKNWDVPGERRGVAIEVEYDIDDQRIYSGANFLAQTPEGGPAGIFNGLYDREYLSSGTGPRPMVPLIETIQPGQHVRGWTVIDAPLDASQLIIRFEASAQYGFWKL